MVSPAWLVPSLPFGATKEGITLRNKNKSKTSSSCTVSVCAWESAISWLENSAVCVKHFTNSVVGRYECSSLRKTLYIKY